MGTAAQNGLKIAAGAIAGLTTAFLALGPATEEYRTAMAKLDSAFQSAGGSAETAEQTYNNLYRVLGDTDVAVEAANHLAQITTNEQELAEWTNICQGVYATFGDSLPIEGLTEAINHTAKLGEVQGPLADALEWSGISADDFNTQLAECSTEAERSALIQETLNGVYGEAAAAYETNAAGIIAQNEAQASLNEAMAKLGEAAEPVLTILTEFGAQILEQITPAIQDFAENNLPKLKDTLTEVGEKIGEVIGWITDNWSTISTIAVIIGGITAAIALLSAGLTAYSTIMGVVTVVTSPVGAIILAIVAAVTALVAIIVVCVKHWDEISAKVKEVASNISNWVSEMVDKAKAKFTEMKENISEKVENIKTAVRDKFDAIKSAIQEKTEAAKQAALKVFDAIKDGIKTRIDTAKTIIKNVLTAIKGIFTGDFGAAKEAVLNIFNTIKDGIKNKIETARDFVKNAIDKIKGFFNFEWSLPKIKLPHFSISGKFSLDPPSIPHISVEWYQRGGIFDKPTLFPFSGGVGGLGENGAEAIVPLEKNTQWMNVLAEKLGALMGSSGAPIVLQVDGKTFAQVSVDSINELTKQRGSLPLVLA